MKFALIALLLLSGTSAFAEFKHIRSSGGSTAGTDAVACKLIIRFERSSFGRIRLVNRAAESDPGSS